MTLPFTPERIAELRAYTSGNSMIAAGEYPRFPPRWEKDGSSDCSAEWDEMLDEIERLRELVASGHAIVWTHYSTRRGWWFKCQCSAEPPINSQSY